MTKNNYLFEKKNETFFHLFLAREQKIRLKNVFIFLSDMNFCFMKTTFSASALEH
jgi:hypothetical protein